MCQAIIDMKKNAYDDGFQKGEESGFQKGEESGFQKGEESGFQKGEESGFQKGEESGFQKGEESGFQKGEERTVTSIVRRMLNAKYDVQEISKMTGVTVQTIDQIIVAHR